MSISAIGNNSNLTNIFTQAEQEVVTDLKAAESSTAKSTTTTATSDTSSLSSMGQFFSNLQQLLTTEPDKAKQILAKISTQIADLAKNAKGSDKEQLNLLVKKYQKASETGNLTYINPQIPAQGGLQNILNSYNKYSQSASNSLVSILAGISNANSTDSNNLISMLTGNSTSSTSGSDLSSIMAQLSGQSSSNSASSSTDLATILSQMSGQSSSTNSTSTTDLASILAKLGINSIG